MNELQTTIKRRGQRYVDVPIIASPLAGSMASAVAAASGGAAPRPFVIGHDRVRLKWVKVFNR